MNDSGRSRFSLSRIYVLWCQLPTGRWQLNPAPILDMRHFRLLILSREKINRGYAAMGRDGVEYGKAIETYIEDEKRIAPPSGGGTEDLFLHP
jgi:hypothetical protein